MYILETENEALYSAQNKARYEAALADVALYQPQAALTFGAEIAAGAGLAANQYQQNIAVNPLNPKQICISCKSPGEGDAALLNSQDGGTTWATAFTMPTTAGDPSVVFDPFGNVYFTFISGASGNPAGFRKSTDGGATWSSATNLTVDCDHPSVTVDMNLSSPYYGSIYIAGQNYAKNGNIDVTYSRDQGATWSTTSTTVSSIAAPGQLALTSCTIMGGTVLPDGTVLFGGGADGGFGAIGGTGASGGLFASAAEMFLFRSTNGGATFSVVDIATKPQVPSLFVGVFSGNTFYSTSNAAHGRNSYGGIRTYVLWPHNSAMQESMMMLQTSDDEGATWTLPRPIAQLPSSGAGSMWIGVNSAGIVGAQFYSLDELGFFTVQFICSLDYGATWSAPVPVTSIKSTNLLTTFHGGTQSRAPGGDEVYGCVGPDDKFYCVWSDARSPATTYTSYMRTVAVAAQY